MWAIRSVRGFALVCVLTGCGDDGGSGESGPSGSTTEVASQSSSSGVMMNEAPTVEARVDVATACSMPGATRVELHAARVGCAKPPPAPCTLPDVPRVTVGDGVDCPAADSPQTLRVELMQTGRYHVEVVTLAGEDEVAAVCWGEDDAVELLIDDARLEQMPTIAVEVLDGSACD